jgi:hypothetical protein
MDDIFRVTQDEAGKPVYTHNNEVVSKDVFDQRNKDSKAQIQEMRNSVTPGIDDDPAMMAMRERAKALMESKRSPKKAKGGSIDLSKCKVNTAKKNPSSSNW